MESEPLEKLAYRVKVIVFRVIPLDNGEEMRRIGEVEIVDETPNFPGRIEDAEREIDALIKKARQFPSE